MRRRSFTLIELLLVISVIAILSGILLPTLAKIKEKIKTTMCLHNLKQNVNGIYTYSADFEGMAPNTSLAGRVFPYSVAEYGIAGSLDAEFPSPYGFVAVPLFAMVAYNYWPATKQLNCASAPLTARYDWRRIKAYLDYTVQVKKKQVGMNYFDVYGPHSSAF